MMRFRRKLGGSNPEHPEKVFEKIITSRTRFMITSGSQSHMMILENRARIVFEDFLRKAAKNSLFKIKCRVYYLRIQKTQKQWKSTYEKLMKLKQSILDRIG